MCTYYIFNWIATMYCIQQITLSLHAQTICWHPIKQEACRVRSPITCKGPTTAILLHCLGKRLQLDLIFWVNISCTLNDISLANSVELVLVVATVASCYHMRYSLIEYANWEVGINLFLLISFKWVNYFFFLTLLNCLFLSFVWEEIWFWCLLLKG